MVNFQALYTSISQLASLTETHVVCITKYYTAELRLAAATESL